jgi:hypothetical protein
VVAVVLNQEVLEAVVLEVVALVEMAQELLAQQILAVAVALVTHLGKMAVQGLLFFLYRLLTTVALQQVHLQ